MVDDDLSSVSLEQLSLHKNWQSQYRLITQWGVLISQKTELRNSQNLIQGCEVAAWLTHEMKEHKHYFKFDCESRVINGLAALLLSRINGTTTVDFQTVDVEKMLSDVGLEKHLTPSRNNGFKSIVLRARELVSCS